MLRGEKSATRIAAAPLVPPVIRAAPQFRPTRAFHLARAFHLEGNTVASATTSKSADRLE